MIKDSGNRREFETGAVRDIAEGKGRCDLLPLDVVSQLCAKREQAEIIGLINDYVRNGHLNSLRTSIVKFITSQVWDLYTSLIEVSIHYEDGSKKYNDRNWEKGIPLHCYIDSGVRHLLKHWRGDTDERHDRAFMWNMLGAIWTHQHKPELIDLPFATECKYREWFGDYEVHICGIDKEICNNIAKCEKRGKKDV